MENSQARQVRDYGYAAPLGWGRLSQFAIVCAIALMGSRIAIDYFTGTRTEWNWGYLTIILIVGIAALTLAFAFFTNKAREQNWDPQLCAISGAAIAALPLIGGLPMGSNGILNSASDIVITALTFYLLRLAATK